MICPKCGEPAVTRHLFCVVCGADLKDVKPEKPGERLKRALRKHSDRKAASAAVSDTAQLPLATETDAVIFPDFMHNYI